MPPLKMPLKGFPSAPTLTPRASTSAVISKYLPLKLSPPDTSSASCFQSALL